MFFIVKQIKYSRITLGNIVSICDSNVYELVYYKIKYHRLSISAFQTVNGVTFIYNIHLYCKKSAAINSWQVVYRLPKYLKGQRFT